MRGKALGSASCRPFEATEPPNAGAHRPAYAGGGRGREVTSPGPTTVATLSQGAGDCQPVTLFRARISPEKHLVHLGVVWLMAVPGALPSYAGLSSHTPSGPSAVSMAQMLPPNINPDYR